MSKIIAKEIVQTEEINFGLLAEQYIQTFYLITLVIKPEQ